MRLEVKIGFRGNFGVKQSPRNTVLGPPGRSDNVLLQVRLSEVASLYVSRVFRDFNGQPVFNARVRF